MRSTSNKIEGQSSAAARHISPRGVPESIASARDNLVAITKKMQDDSLHDDAATRPLTPCTPHTPGAEFGCREGMLPSTTWWPQSSAPAGVDQEVWCASRAPCSGTEEYYSEPEPMVYLSLLQACSLQSSTASLGGDGSEAYSSDTQSRCSSCTEGLISRYAQEGLRALVRERRAKRGVNHVPPCLGPKNDDCSSVSTRSSKRRCFRSNPSRARVIVQLTPVTPRGPADDMQVS